MIQKQTHSKQQDKVKRDNRTHRKHAQNHAVVHPHLEKLGAIVLTAVSALVSFEAIVEHHGHAVHHDSHEAGSASQIMARGETKGETARLPEEFDIGLQTPHVSGI